MAVRSVAHFGRLAACCASHASRAVTLTRSAALALLPLGPAGVCWWLECANTHVDPLRMPAARPARPPAVHPCGQGTRGVERARPQANRGTLGGIGKVIFAFGAGFCFSSFATQPYAAASAIAQRMANSPSRSAHRTDRYRMCA